MIVTRAIKKEYFASCYNIPLPTTRPNSVVEDLEVAPTFEELKLMYQPKVPVKIEPEDDIWYTNFSTF